MKRMYPVLAALALLGLLCGCTPRRDSPGTQPPAAQQATTGAQQTTAQTEATEPQTEPSTEAPTQEVGFVPIEGGDADSGILQPLPIPGGEVVVFPVEPTEPTIGLPTPVEPTLVVESAGQSPGAGE